jgi:hypothetical protein
MSEWVQQCRLYEGESSFRYNAGNGDTAGKWGRSKTRRDAARCGETQRDAARRSETRRDATGAFVTGLYFQWVALKRVVGVTTQRSSMVRNGLTLN